MSDTKEESELDKEVKAQLLKVFNCLESDNYLQALKEISILVGSDYDIKPLYEVLSERKKVFDIMTEIMKVGGRYTFSSNTPVPTGTLIRNHLDENEKLLYKICFGREDYGISAPVSGFSHLFELIKKYPDIGRKNLINYYFFGEYFGVKKITKDEFYRNGMGFALEQMKRRFIFSTKFEKNVPASGEPFIFYSGEDKKIRYISSNFGSYELQLKKKDLEYQLKQTNLQTSGLNEEQKSSLSGAVNYMFETYLFPELGRERFDDAKTMALFPPTLLHFFSFRAGSYGENMASIMVQYVTEKNIPILQKLMELHPKCGICVAHEDSFHNHGESPLLYFVLESKDEKFINWFLFGQNKILGFNDTIDYQNLGEAREKYILPSLYNCCYSWYGSGNSTIEPLIHRLYQSFRVRATNFKDFRYTDDEGLTSWSFRIVDRYYKLDEKDRREMTEEEKRLDGKYEKFKKLKDAAFKKKREMEIHTMNECNVALKRLLFHMSPFMDLNALLIQSRRYGGVTKESIVEVIVSDDNTDFAKFLIEKLPIMLFRYYEENKNIPKFEILPPYSQHGDGGQNKIIGYTNTGTIDVINYFSINDLKLLGEESENINTCNPRRIKNARSKDIKIDRRNDTYKYIQSKRTFWNPLNFEYFPREYKHVVCLFKWCLRKIGFYLPPEMINEVFSFVDFFDFPYILGDYVKLRNNEKERIYVWRTPLPDFGNLNLRLYRHEVLKIKKAGRECFSELRGDFGDLEFKGLIEYCRCSRDSFFKYLKSDKISEGKRRYYGDQMNRTCHHDLIRVIGDLKNEMSYRNQMDEDSEVFEKEIVELMDEQRVYEIAKVQLRIDTDKKNEGSWYARPQRRDINWLSDDIPLKHYSLPKETKMKNLEECVKLFFKFVRNLE